MPFDMVLVFVLVVAAVVLFVLERQPVGLVAIMIMATLMATGVLTAEEGLSGFSSRATVTIGAMFMISEGVRRTGALERVGDLLLRVGRGRPRAALVVMMLVVGAVSALINNTAAIAIFIPVVLSASATMEVSPSRLLMPISFASMIGGVCTLIGTSTNILVSEIAVKHGLPGFGMFELTAVGLVFMVVGVVYLATVGWRLVPGRRASDRMSGYELSRYITDVVVKESSPLVGRPLGEDEDLARGSLEIVDVFREGREVPGRLTLVEAHAGDVLRIHGGVEQLERILERSGLEVAGAADWRRENLDDSDHVLVEMVVAPDSPLARLAVREIDFVGRFGAAPLAIQRHGSLRRRSLGDVQLEPGDCLLLAVDADRLGEIETDPAFVLTSRVMRARRRARKMPIALAIVAGVVLATALDLRPIAVNAVVGAIAMMLTGCLKIEEGLKSVHWDVILLLAGLIPLGVAMEKTGAVSLLAEATTGALGSLGPHAVLGGVLLLTMMLTSILNNQASALLLAPMVIGVAGALGADPRPFLIAVTYGASLSFVTPVGYQTNTMIYGPGQYRFSDFFRVGFGLNVLLWIAGTLLIPLVWPL